VAPFAVVRTGGTRGESHPMSYANRPARCRFPLPCLYFVCLLVVGCGHLPPLRTQSQVEMALREGVSAKVEATLNTLPDPAAMREVPVPPYGPHPGDDKIAVIDVDGLLVDVDNVGPYSTGDNPVSSFQEKLDAAAADPAVKAVVLRINSPGGGVAATAMMARALADFRRCSRKPVVACLLDVGAGGGYYLASGCDQVVAMPTSVVGGIGAVLNLYFLELAMEQWQVFSQTIKSGDRVDMGSSLRKMSKDEKALLTAMAQEYHIQFKDAVRRGRPRVKADSDVFDGRVMTTSKAIEEGLVDAAGYLPDAVERARQLAGAGAAGAVMYRRPGTAARSLYETVPSRPAPGLNLPLSIPGLDRSRLPLFLYLWQVEPTVVRVTGPY
jgi:protease IV